MEARGSAPRTRNHYRSVVSRMYAVALLPKFRAATGITVNPMVGVPRDRTESRTVTVTLDELQQWLSVASYHVRLAVGIAALAPKLRLQNILALTWADHLDPDLTYITVEHHKTAGRTGLPLVVPISEQLRTILRDARTRNRGAYVVEYRGGPVTSIRDGVRLAAERAGLTYGRDRGGVTFHTLRHSMGHHAGRVGDAGEPAQGGHGARAD